MLQELFISYSRQDSALVESQVARLQRYFRVWIDRKMSVGKAFPEELANRIRASAGVILFLSPHSVKSDWVNKEISTAEANGVPFAPVMLVNSDVPAALVRLNYLSVDDEDFFGKLLDSLHEFAPTARRHPGRSTDVYRQVDAHTRTFAATAQELDGAIHLDSVGSNSLVGIPIKFERHHAVYLIGFGDDTIERTDTVQVGLQCTGSFPGDDMPFDIARFVANQTPTQPLRLLLIRSMLNKRGDEYDYDPAHPEEWEDAVRVTRWAVTNAYARQPDRLQFFMKAPSVLAMQIGLELASLRKVRFEMYHLDEDEKEYAPVFGKGESHS